MIKDLNKVFEELLNRYVNSIETNYKQQYKKAKDKEFVKEELKNGTDFMVDWEAVSIEKGKLIALFSDMYKRGDDLNKILAHLKKVFGEVDDIKPFKLIENGKKITLYLSDEEKALKKLALNERKLLKVLIRDAAYREIQKRLPMMFDENTSVAKTKKNDLIQWTAPKDAKNDFVQLIYGLHLAGFINDGKGEIIKITETLADAFGIELSKNWQSNHSASIHKSNADYIPPVFDRTKEEYLKYFKNKRKEKIKK
jgi:hypothetical protein